MSSKKAPGGTWQTFIKRPIAFPSQASGGFSSGTALHAEEANRVIMIEEWRARNQREGPEGGEDRSANCRDTQDRSLGVAQRQVNHQPIFDDANHT
jgi:hypothetical protein